MLPLESWKPGTARVAAHPPSGQSTAQAALSAPGMGNGVQIGAAARPAALAMVPTAAALLQALRRRWPFALGVGLLAPRRAWPRSCLVPITPVPVSGAGRRQSRGGVRFKILFETVENKASNQAYVRNQLFLIKSRPVLNAALRQPDVAKLRAVNESVDPILWLEKNIRTAIDGEILQISMTGDNPQELVTPGQRGDGFLLPRGRRSGAQGSGWAQFNKLKELYNKYQDGLQTKRQTLRKLAEAAGSKDQDTLAYKNELAIQRHAGAQREQMEFEAELRRLEAEVKVIRAQDQPATADGVGASAAIPDDMLDEFVEQEPGVQQLISEVARLERSSIRKARRVVRQDHDPSLQRPLRDLEATRKQLADRRASLRVRFAKQPPTQDSSGQPGGNGLAPLLKHIAILKELITVVVAAETKRVPEQGAGAFESDSSLDLESIQDEIDQADRAGKMIGQEVEAMNVELHAPSRIRLMEKAELPRSKEEKNSARMAGLAGLGRVRPGRLRRVLPGVPGPPRSDCRANLARAWDSPARHPP